MDGLEAQNGGYFIKNIRKLAFFEKKCSKTCKFRKIYLYLQHEKSSGWRYHKNNKNLVVIKSHTIYKNDKITFLRGPLKEKEELF